MDMQIESASTTEKARGLKSLWGTLASVLRRFTIRARMWTLLVIFTAALLAVGATAVVAQRQAGQTTTAFLTRDLVALNLIGELQIMMGELRQHEKDMLINYENADDAEKAKKAWLATFARVSETAGRLQVVLPDDEGKKRLAEALRRLDAFKTGFMPIARQLEKNLLSSGRSAVALMQPILPEFAAAQEQLVELFKQIDVGAKQAEENLSRTADAVVMTVMLITAGVLAISLPFTLLNLASIVGPVRHAEDVARSIAAGDLRTAVHADAGADEIANLLRSLSSMKNALTRLVREIRQSASSISTATSDIAAGNLDLSHRTDETASSLRALASSMSTLAGKVQEGAASAQAADTFAETTAEAANKGGESVSSAATTMVDIAGRSRKIADIVDVLSGVSFQTNILAINAAVEAAHAGERGRGFAVVAAEVRALADRSSKAAKDIAVLVDESVQGVQAGAKQVGSAGNTIGGIVTSVNQVASVVAELSDSAVEQSRRIAEVTATVSSLDQMTQQNAALVEESAAAAESLKGQVDRLVALVDAFQLES